MAYMNQEKKSKLAPAIKAHCKKHGVKASLGVNNHSTLVVNIKSGPLDFCQNFYDANVQIHAQRFPNNPMQKPENIQVNEFWTHEHYTGKCEKFLTELVRLMNIGNHDNSDVQTDYFDVGWYVNINIGNWNKPYELVK